MEGTEECCEFNTENIGVIYNEQLTEHIEELKELSTTLAGDAGVYRQNAGDLQISSLKEYLGTALQNIAYSLTLATQKIDDGLRLQCDDIENLNKEVKEISVTLDIKKERRNRVTLGELTVMKRRPSRSLIKVVDDPLSDWKKPRGRYRRQGLDYTVLDHVGVMGLKSGQSDNDHSNISQRGSIGSTVLYDTMRRTTSIQIQEETRPGITTLKRGNLKKLVTKKAIIEEEEEEEEDKINLDLEKEEEEEEEVERVQRRRPNMVISFDNFEENLPAPPPAPNTAIRLSSLPAIPDEFSSVFSQEREDTILEEPELSPDLDVGQMTNPFEDSDEEIPDPFDTDDLPPPPPLPQSVQTSH